MLKFRTIKRRGMDMPMSTFPAVQMVSFRRDFKEEITLHEDDFVTHDDSTHVMTVEHADGSIDSYPYEIVYPDDDNVE